MKMPTGAVRAVYAHLMHFLKKCYRDNVSAMAGQSAFFILLSIVPFAMFGFSLFSILTGKTLSNYYVLSLNDDVDAYVHYILNFIENSMQRANSGRAVVTAMITLWSAGKGMYCITEGIARIYHLPNRYIWVQKRVFAMGYTIVVLLMLVISVGAAALTIFFTKSVVRVFSLDSFFHTLLYVLLYLLFAFLQAVLMALSLLLYLRRRIKNKRYASFRALLPGMLLTVIAWNGLTIGVMIYLRHFAVSSIYGSLASVIVVMVWVYFLMYLLLYGIQLNYIYRKRFASLRPLRWMIEHRQKHKDNAKKKTKSSQQQETVKK